MNWDVAHIPEFWEGKRLAYPDVPKEHAKFSRCVVVGNPRPIPRYKPSSRVEAVKASQSRMAPKVPFLTPPK